MGVLIEPHRVEDEKLGFGAPVRGGRDPGGLEVLLSLECHEPGIAGIRLQGQRVVDVAGEGERGTVRTGSTKAVDTSGSSSMSLSLMAWKPRIEDPSKPSPSRIIASSRVAAGMEKCCQVPGRSQNFTSTTWIFFSLINSSTCCTSLEVEGCGSAAGRTVVAMVLSGWGQE